MKEQTFNFLKQLINSKEIGNIFLRNELVTMMIKYYHPGPKDSKNSTIRSSSNPALCVLIKKGFIERVDRGKYKVLKHIPCDFTYKDVKYDYDY